MAALSRCALLGILLASSGCFAEIWGGVSPWTRSTAHTSPAMTEEEHDEVCWSAGIAVGFWLEAWGFGVGLAPSAVEGNVTYDVDGKSGMVTNRSLHTRLDVDLPTRWMSPWIYPRATLVVDFAREAVVSTGGVSGWVTPADGYGVYGGFTTTLFNRGAALSIGPSYMEYRSRMGLTDGSLLETSTRAVGFQARFHITFTPALDVMRFYKPSVIRPLPEGATYKEESLDRRRNPAGCAFNPHCY